MNMIASGQEKRNKGTHIGKEETKLCHLFEDDMILHIENPQEFV